MWSPDEVEDEDIRPRCAGASVPRPEIRPVSMKPVHSIRHRRRRDQLPSRRSAGLHQGRNVGGQRAPDRKRRALHQAEIGARAGPIWHYVALRGTRSTSTCSGGGVVPSLPKGCAFLGLGPICTGCSRGDLGQNGGKPGGREARRRETRRHAGPVRLRARLQRLLPVDHRDRQPGSCRSLAGSCSYSRIADLLVLSRF